MAKQSIQKSIVADTVQILCSFVSARAQVLLTLFLCLAILITPTVTFSATKKTDLRILIDVSGSMKENDPQNLRIPSVKLLVGLIPNGTKAGIWTFGKYVNMQVKHGVVNKSWKTIARKEAAQIHSRGLYTNIEDVLKRSTSNWQRKDPNTSRHLILLTDGVVDISKDPKINLKSRNKVIDYYLPKLKKAGVKIHTIALSKQADHDLLKLMSVSTDGWYELIEDPQKLHRVFLRIFEKASSANALPLENNKFKVDKSIKDMTVLTFHNVKAKSKTKLISPSKKTYTKTDNPDSVTWFHEEGYDLITVTHPEAGDWQLDAPIDKDNRVIVVTNLTLSVTDISNNVLLNQRIPIVVELKQKGKQIRNLNFLKLVKVNVIKKALNEPDLKVQLLDNGKGFDKKINDGKYFGELRSPLRAGIFELIVTAEGPTFKRQRKYLVNVFNGLADVEIHDAKNKEPFSIEIIPHKGLLQKGSVDISYEVNNGATQRMSKDQDEKWKLELAADQAGMKVSFTVKGLRQNNKSVEMQMERVLPERIKEIVKSIETEYPEKLEEKHDTKIEKEQQEEESGWLSILIWVIVVNLILILIGAIAYFVLKKVRAKTAIEDKEDLEL